MALAVRIRQGIADALVFLLSTQLMHQLVATIDMAMEPRNGGLPPLTALLSPAVTAFALVCAVYLTEESLRGARLLGSYPPRRLIPLALHFLGLLYGLVTVLAERRPGG